MEEEEEEGGGGGAPTEAQSPKQPPPPPPQEDDEDEDEEAGGDLRTNLDVDDGEEAQEAGLRVQEVDAYWLQRRIAKAYGSDIDADKSQVCVCVCGGRALIKLLRARHRLYRLHVPSLSLEFLNAF